MDFNFVVAGLIIFFAIVVVAIALRRIIALKNKIKGLEHEIEIQDSKLNYQKDQYSESVNYFYSAMIIIMELMQEIDNALKSEEGNLPEKILSIIFEKIKTLFNPDQYAVFTIDQENNLCVPLFSSGYEDDIKLIQKSFIPNADNSLVGWSVVTGRFLSYLQAQQDPLLSHLLDKDPFECRYSQPLKVNNKVKAVLCLGEIRQQLDNDSIMRLFSFLSNIASVALSNALLTQKLRELSIRDGLTGLYNHSYFQKVLENSLSGLKDKDGTFCLVMVDLDNFKVINDKCGHQAGDIVIKGMSKLFKEIKCENYICARYGGDEFAFIFRGKNTNETFSFMEELRKEVSQEKFTMQNQQRGVTISAGIAEGRFPESKNLDKNILIESADQALYKAKAEGKNKIVIAKGG